MKYYEGISSIIKSGEFLKSKNNVYKIEDLISNGINKVYLATDSLGKKVAIKQFYFKEKEFLELQYWLYENINHDFIDKPLEMFEIKSFHFQIKPFYEFLPFENFSSQKIPLNIKKQLLLNIALFLKYIHSQNIVHTDLKPEQFILVDKKLKLLDFDFAVSDKFYFPGGTKEWFSPEHIKKEKIDLKSDVFSFALMAHWILSSKHPFENHFDDNFEHALLNEQYQLEVYKELFAKMLSVDKSKRANIDEFIKYFQTPSKFYLIMNNKKYLVIKNILITREICKRIFKNHKQIAPKQFEIIKKEDGWVVKGLKDSRFSRVFVDGKDATNKEIPIFDNSVIKVANIEFKVIF